MSDIKEKGAEEYRAASHHWQKMCGELEKEIVRLQKGIEDAYESFEFSECLTKLNELKNKK